MRTARRHWVLATVLVAAGLVFSGTPAMAAVSSKGTPRGYTCTGGEIPSGNYASITVRGACSVPANAGINVAGNVDVRTGGSLDAQSAPSTITVGHNVTAAPGSTLGLGCQPDYFNPDGSPLKTGHPCIEPPDGVSTILVKGNVTALGADLVLLNGIKVNGNVTLLGGGGPIPWSVKNNTIDRNLTVAGQTTDWLGVLFNSVGGNATLIHITLTEDHPDASGAVYVVRNTIGRNLICMGLTPGVSGGFIPGSVNVVGGHAIGQCASLV